MVLDGEFQAMGFGPRHAPLTVSTKPFQTGSQSNPSAMSMWNFVFRGAALDVIVPRANRWSALSVPLPMARRY